MPYCSSSRNTQVRLVEVPVSMGYAKAAEKGALQWACAGATEPLAAYFDSRRLRYQSELVRKMGGDLCHILYEPTVAGFRASADNAAVSEIFANVNTLAFLAKRREDAGDSLGVLKRVLRDSEKPLEVTLDLSVSGEERQVAEALRFHFGRGPHRFRIHHDGHGDVDPWVQDLFKYGYTQGQRRVLVTRQAYEGSAENGALLEPMLGSFTGDPYVRSKLAFEGGDLLFAVVPGAKERVVLFYGTSAKPYWGEALTREEFAYVLQAEFGADEAVYFGDVTPHVDYSLALLSDGVTALVAEPQCGDARVAASVTTLLEELEEAGGGAKEEAQRLEVTAYVSEHCPGKPGECVAPERMPELVEQEPALVRTWLRLGNAVQLRKALVPRLREILRRQAAGCDPEHRRKLDENAAMLQRMGFRVVRVPWLEGEASSDSRWPGISYVNAAVIGESIFVPELGLGEVEEEWFGELQRELPGFRVVATPAANLLLQNGGIHCVLAFGRVR
ncbi:MAG: agmatine deiminase family protein [Bryobacterales bacterium]|nr:agmatine deiminase family protein [Bryobacterales bacterium]